MQSETASFPPTYLFLQPCLLCLLVGTHLPIKKNQNILNVVKSSETIFFVTSFSGQGLPRGNGHEWDSKVPWKVPSLPNNITRKGWPHHQGLRPLHFSNSGAGSFMSHKNRSVKVLWYGTYSSLSLFEKTRKSNHLQMSLQRQHFLLSFLKTLGVGPAGVRTRNLPLSRSVLSQLSQPGDGYRANLPLSQMGQLISWIELCIWCLVWN